MNRKQRRAAKSGQKAGKPSSGFQANNPSADAAALVEAGLHHQQAGRLAEAEACYRRALQVHPDNPDAFYRLGCLFYREGHAGVAAGLIAQAIRRDEQNPLYRSDLGSALLMLNRCEEALASYDKALALSPGFAQAVYNRANALMKLKRFEEALAGYEKALTLDPNFAEALFNRGNALQELKRLDEAVASYDRALTIAPAFAEASYNRGNALMGLRRFEESLASYDRTLALKPGFAEAFNNRANALRELKRYKEALASCDRALALKPGLAEALNNRGAALHELKRFDEAVANYNGALALQPYYAEAFNNGANALHELKRYEDALANCERALALKPDYAEAFNTRGNALRELKRFDEAGTSYKRALALKPDYALAFNNLGATLKALKRFDEAIESYEAALALKPDYAEAFVNQGNALHELKRYEEALASYEAALALKPDMAEALSGAMWCANSLCDWGRKAALSARATELIAEQGSYVLPFSLLGYSGDPSLQLQCARNFAASEFPSPPRPMRSGAPRRGEKLRIAYLSADFHEHATACLTARLFELHDRSRFEVIALSFGADDGSAMRKRLAAAFDRFIDVRLMSDEAAARLLHGLETDIAVDLKGYTQDARPGIFAYRPAPVQAAYLGYPGTMGVPFIDYIVADATVAPAAHEPFYSEKIVQLPDCYQVNDCERKIAAHTPSRQEAGLPKEGFVFCCFNGNWKIAPDVFDVWMRLLHATEGSVLWLIHGNEGARRNLCAEAQARGVDPGRLIFAPRLPGDEHLARHRLADLFLDTLPCNAHTTASDALWAGLPVLTQQGEAFAGRAAASLVKAIGLPELVTHSLAEYEALALRLAREPALLASYRDRLAANRLAYPLFDTDRFRRHIETAYLKMWEICERGEPPRGFKVEAEGMCTP